MNKFGVVTRKIKAWGVERWEKFKVWGKEKWAEFQAWRRRFFRIEVVKDEDLIRAYAGRNYEKFKKRKFNIAAFFFSVIYLLFRKLYIAGVMVFVLDIVVINLVHSHVIHLVDALTLGAIVNLVASIIVAFVVNKYYIFAVGVKIGRLKVRYPGRSQAEMRGICEAKGGTNSIALTIGFLAKVISSVVMVVNVIFSDVVVELENPFSETIEAVRSEVDKVVEQVKGAVQEGVKSVKGTVHKGDEEVKHEKIEFKNSEK